MNSSVFAPLGWISAAVAVIGILIYFAAMFRPPRYVRLVNSSGLMLSALGLGEIASYGGRAAATNFGFNTALAETFLIFAVLVQAWGALRRRKNWDGVDRRSARSLP